MISFSRLLVGDEYFGDSLRYHHGAKGHHQGTVRGKGPIVVWNCTKACNLRCRHCYSSCTGPKDQNEMTTEMAKDFMRQLKAYHVPVLLFSGGEPLMRQDLFELMAYGNELGMRMVVSTNGTLISPEVAQKLKALNTSYVGISLDGLEAVNDSFRGVEGAFEKALAGLRNCAQAGQKTGLRLTLSRTTVENLAEIFDLIEAEHIPRVCFYHLVYSGRGSEIQAEDLRPEEKKRALDFIISKTLDFKARGIKTEILTVDNHCDGIYLYEYMKERDEERANQIMELISTNGGNRSGVAISAVDWEGNVYIDQFTKDIALGNVLEKSFGEIWDGEGNAFLKALRMRKEHLKGRCKTCKWLDQCGGNFRARALSTGDFWNPDPACYFSDEEIAK